MQISKFTLNRVAHIIQARGDLFLFSGYERDSNNELDTSTPRRNSVKGLFHETNSHITLLGADIGSVQTKPNPGILATLAEASKLKIYLTSLRKELRRLLNQLLLKLCCR
jgi:hypothetical protein